MLLLCASYAILRICDILPKNSTLDNVVIPAGIILAIFPLISEASFLGFSVKKEINELKADMKDELINIRSEIVDVRISASQSVKTVVNNNNNNEPPSLKQVEEDNNEAKRKKKLSIQDLKIKNEEISNLIDNDVLFLLQAKYLIEKRVYRFYDEATILKKTTLKDDIKQMFELPVIKKYIDDYSTYNLQISVDKIIQILNICIAFFDNNISDQEYIEFVKLNIDEALGLLDKANEILDIRSAVVKEQLSFIKEN